MRSASVVLVEEPEVLVETARCRVIREQAVRGRSAHLGREIMIERRRTDPAVKRTESGIRSGANDLIDESRNGSRGRASSCTSGIDLQLLLAQARERSAGVIIERAIHRNAVIFVADLIIIAAANIQRLPVTLLSLRHIGAG